MNKQDMLNIAQLVFQEEEAQTILKGDKTEIIAITIKELEMFYKLAFNQGKRHCIDYLKYDAERLKGLGYYEDYHYLGLLALEIESGCKINL
jgi:hypothetical protein